MYDYLPINKNVTNCEWQKIESASEDEPDYDNYLAQITQDFGGPLQIGPPDHTDYDLGLPKSTAKNK